MVSTKDIQKLRTESGFGIIECKNALEKSKGDIKKAIEVLKKSGKMKAAKKADRATEQGLVECYVHDSRIGVLLEVNCETDFVARNDEFKDFVHDLAMQIASMNPKDVLALKKQAYIKDMDVTVEDLLNEKIGKIGENIQIKRFTRYELGE